MSRDGWDPSQYNKFRAERRAPFADLLACIEKRPGMRVLDLGCGTGELSAELAEALEVAELVGVDSSPAMLAQAAPRAGARVRFVEGDITAWADRVGEYDLVFSHAALQWVPEHARLIPRMLAAMTPGAQLAVQVPNNFEHPSHTVASELARSPEFRARLADARPPGGLLRLERYAELLDAHGFAGQVCFEKIYGHALASSADVVEWVRGTMLTAYLTRLDAAGQADFLAQYRARLMAALGERAPYFYAFRRLLFWGRKGRGPARAVSAPPPPAPRGSG